MRAKSQCTACAWSFADGRSWCQWCRAPCSVGGKQLRTFAEAARSFNQQPSQSGWSGGSGKGAGQQQPQHRPSQPFQPRHEKAKQQPQPFEGAGGAGPFEAGDDEAGMESAGLPDLDAMLALVPPEAHEATKAAFAAKQKEAALRASEAEVPTDFKLHVLKQRQAKSAKQLEAAKVRFEEAREGLADRLEKKGALDDKVSDMEVLLRAGTAGGGGPQPPNHAAEEVLSSLVGLLGQVAPESLPPQVAVLLVELASAAAARGPQPPPPDAKARVDDNDDGAGGAPMDQEADEPVLGSACPAAQGASQKAQGKRQGQQSSEEDPKKRALAEAVGKSAAELEVDFKRCRAEAKACALSSS
jgi:hypothetical protein